MTGTAVSLLQLLSWCLLAAAGIVTEEFKCSPFDGDPEKADLGETVSGKAFVFVNNVLMAGQEVGKKGRSRCLDGQSAC